MFLRHIHRHDHSTTTPINRHNICCKRWAVERTQSWMNGYGKLRRRGDRNGADVGFYPCLAAALVTLRMLICQATTRCPWDGRTTTRRLQ